MKTGYIKIYRSILDWEWASNKRMLLFWIYLLMKANWEDKEWCGITIKRGSFVTTISELSEEVGLPVITVRRYLDLLRMSEQVSIKMSKKHTTISICNYGSYQANEQINEQINEQQSEQQLKKEEINIKEGDNNGACARTREEEQVTPPQTPPQNPFNISSVERDVYGKLPGGIIRLKREKVARILSSIADNPEIQMPQSEQELYIDWYCEPVSESSETVRAENLTAFTVYASAKRWMDKRRSMAGKQPPKEKQTLGEYYKDLIKKMQSRYGNYEQSDSGIPDEQ